MKKTNKLTSILTVLTILILLVTIGVVLSTIASATQNTYQISTAQQLKELLETGSCVIGEETVTLAENDIIEITNNIYLGDATWAEGMPASCQVAKTIKVTIRSAGNDRFTIFRGKSGLAAEVTSYAPMFYVHAEERPEESSADFVPSGAVLTFENIILDGQREYVKSNKNANDTQVDGGAFALASYATVVFGDGTTVQNFEAYRGGVALLSTHSNVVVLDGAEIRNNHGVYDISVFKNGNIWIMGGLITGNTGGSHVSGNVYQSDAVIGVEDNNHNVYMYGGEISDNNAQIPTDGTATGGNAILLAKGATLYMEGGTITANNVPNNDPLHPDNAAIYADGESSSASESWLNSKVRLGVGVVPDSVTKPAAVVAALESREETPIMIYGNKSTMGTEEFKDWGLNLTSAPQNTNLDWLTVGTLPAGSRIECMMVGVQELIDMGSSATSETTEETEGSGDAETPETPETSVSLQTYYYTFEKALKVAHNHDIENPTLLLNYFYGSKELPIDQYTKYTIDGDEKIFFHQTDDFMFTIPARADITIRNMTLDGVDLYADNGALSVQAEATLTLGSGMTIQNFNAMAGAAVSNSGTLILLDGSVITQNTAVRKGSAINSNGKVYMLGGTISKNICTTTEADFGSAVYVASGGGFYMFGGLITENQNCADPDVDTVTASYGTAIGIEGECVIEGGSVMGNLTWSAAADHNTDNASKAIYLSETGTLKIGTGFVADKPTILGETSNPVEIYDNKSNIIKSDTLNWEYWGHNIGVADSETVAYDTLVEVGTLPEGSRIDLAKVTANGKTYAGVEFAVKAGEANLTLEALCGTSGQYFLPGGTYTIDGGGKTFKRTIGTASMFKLRDNATVTLANITLHGDDIPSSIEGGAFILANTTMTLILDDNVTIQNFRANHGGAIKSSGILILLQGSELKQNICGGNGSAIHSTGSKAQVWIVGGKLTNNQSTATYPGNYGAALSFDNGRGFLLAGEISGNQNGKTDDGTRSSSGSAVTTYHWAGFFITGGKITENITYTAPITSENPDNAAIYVMGNGGGTSTSSTSVVIGDGYGTVDGQERLAPEIVAQELAAIVTANEGKNVAIEIHGNYTVNMKDGASEGERVYIGRNIGASSKIVPVKDGNSLGKSVKFGNKIPEGSRIDILPVTVTAAVDGQKYNLLSIDFAMQALADGTVTSIALRQMTDTEGNPVNGRYFLPTGTYEIDGGSLKRAMATESMFTLRDGANVTLKNVTLDGGNVASEVNGGAFHLKSGTSLTINSGTIIQNFKAKNGGAIYLDSGTLTMTGGTVSGNKATRGGGIYTSRGTLTINGGAISGNSASERGGGVHMYQTKFSMTDGEVSANTAPDGAGLYYQSDVVINEVLTISGGTFDGNIATNNGGAMHWGTDWLKTHYVTISGDVKIQNNQAKNGGAIFVTQANTYLTVSGGTISGNTAENGGAIYNSSAHVTVSGGTISGNTALGNGGAIYAVYVWNEMAGTVISGGTISGNTASGNGGAICAYDHMPLSISGDVQISGNIADHGRGIYLTGTNTLVMTGGKITGNGTPAAAWTFGGGIYATSDTTIWILGGEISGNIVGFKGAGIASEGTVYILGGTIKDNKFGNNNGEYRYVYGYAVIAKNLYLLGGEITGNTIGNGGKAGKAGNGAVSTFKDGHIYLGSSVTVDAVPDAVSSSGLVDVLGTTVSTKTPLLIYDNEYANIAQTVADGIHGGEKELVGGNYVTITSDLYAGSRVDFSDNYDDGDDTTEDFFLATAFEPNATTLAAIRLLGADTAYGAKLNGAKTALVWPTDDYLIYQQTGLSDMIRYSLIFACRDTSKQTAIQEKINVTFDNVIPGTLSASGIWYNVIMPPKCLTDKVTVIYDGVEIYESTTGEGEEAVNVPFTLLAYLQKIIENKAVYGEKEADVAQSIIYYGSASQETFRYPANGIADPEYKTALENVLIQKNESPIRPTNISGKPQFARADVYVDSQIYIKLTLKDMSNSYKLVETDKDGKVLKTLEATAEASTATYELSIPASELSATKYFAVVEMTDEGDVTATHSKLEYGVTIFIRNIYREDHEKHDLLKSIYYYSQMVDALTGKN